MVRISDGFAVKRQNIAAIPGRLMWDAMAKKRTDTGYWPDTEKKISQRVIILGVL
jgi:hypothetical protein